MFFLDSEFRVTRIAGSLAEWFDQEESDLVGAPITAVVPPADIQTVDAALEQVLETRTSQTIACHLDVDGEPIPVDIEFAPIASEATFGTILGTVHRETIPADRSTTRLVQLRNFIELLDDAAVVYELTESGPTVQAVNSAFQETFGYEAQYIVGKPLNDYIVPAESRQEAARFDEQVADGKVTTDIVRRETANGIRQFAYRGLPIDHGSGRHYGLAVYADTTERQQTKQHLQVLHRVLRHNVRNELTVVFGMAERILADTDDEGIRTAAERIITSGETLASVSEKARMAEDILGDSPSDTIVEVGDTTADVVDESRTRWPEATFETDIERPLPVSSGLEIRDALENLVENAVVHNTGTPNVRVTARAKTPIHASTRATGQQAVITVADDGPGIPEHEQAVIFEGADVTQLTHGSGLGLWVVRWIVESADGTVSYSRVDGWTKITLRLPIATDVTDASEPGQADQDSC